ncbi:uncharacterized protein [Amphiura filiformis]|uniref:uncharacterized protein n=1 Tax=Amphiura filiformis TaxID=82378 RepID=UPI003B20C8F4
MNEEAKQDAGQDNEQAGLNVSNNNYPISDAAESRYAFTVDEFPNIANNEYYRYIQALIKLLVGEKVLQDWVTKGLSARLMENLAIQKSSWQRPPILIDPDMEGVRWMRKIIHSEKLTNIDMYTRCRASHLRLRGDSGVARVLNYEGEGSYVSHLENKLGFDPSIVVRIEKAILSGLPLLLMNTEASLDSMVMPLIHHANHGTEHKGMEDARLIKYCGRRLLGHENFHVTLATGHPNPHFSPRIASSTMLLNYNASPETMREELLDRAFARVTPHLHAERSKVLAALQQHRNTVQALEDQLLKTLEGDVGSSDITAHTEYVSAIVDNRDQVYQKLVEAEKVLESLDKICEELMPVAKRGAMLYAVISSLRGIQREYQFSLPFFLWMFDQAIGDEPTDSEDAEKEQVGSEYAESEMAGGRRSAVTDELHEEKVDAIGPSLAERIMGYESKKIDSPQHGVSGRAKEEPLLQRIMSDISIPDSPELPPPGVAYNSLSVNQVKQLVDSLTQTVFQNIRQCLYEEHRLLYATMLCLNIEFETTENFSEEEMALLLQGSYTHIASSRPHPLSRMPGNPGLGNMELSLADFDCDAPAPSFIADDKWDDILAMSVLPGPLDGLCVQIAEIPDAWESWYKADAPENEGLPLKPGTADGEQERQIDDRGQVSTQSSPDLGNLTDFHQLILLRIMRPDRLPSAMSRYVNRHLTSVKPLVSSIGSIIGSSERLLGVMVLLPPTPAFGNKQLMSNFSLKQKA